MEVLVLELLLSRFLYQLESMCLWLLITQGKWIISAHTLAAVMCVEFSGPPYTIFKVGGSPSEAHYAH